MGLVAFTRLIFFPAMASNTLDVALSERAFSDGSDDSNELAKSYREFLENYHLRWSAFDGLVATHPWAQPAS
jgi:hypothetical protein